MVHSVILHPLRVAPAPLLLKATMGITNPALLSLFCHVQGFTWAVTVSHTRGARPGQSSLQVPELPTARNAVPTPPPEHATRLTSYVGFFQSRHWNLMNFRRLLSVSQGADTACIVHCGQAEGTGSKAPRDEWDPCPTTCFALKWDRPFLWPEPLSVCQTMLGGGSAPQASGCVPHTAQDTHSSLFGLLADHLLW